MFDFQWGPHELYSTLVFMLLAIPFGWLYAYITYVGYRKDITQDNPERTKIAIGGALVAAFLIFASRHVVHGDALQWGRALSDWAFSLVGQAVHGASNILVDRMNHASNLLIRLAWAIVGTFALPALVGVVLCVGMFALFFGTLGAGVLIGSSIAAVYSAAAAAIVALPGFLMGLPIILYFLFVRLPLQLVYHRAVRDGRWPTTEELVWALEKGTLGQTGWQSAIMAYKAGKLRSELNARANKIHGKSN